MEKEESEIIQKTKNLIDELKAVCNTNGIGNSPSEYKIITEVFLYKFLNDKFLYEIRKIDSNLEKLSTRELEKQIKDMSEVEISCYPLFGITNFQAIQESWTYILVVCEIKLKRIQKIRNISEPFADSVINLRRLQNR